GDWYHGMGRVVEVLIKGHRLIARRPRRKSVGDGGAALQTTSREGRSEQLLNRRSVGLVQLAPAFEQRQLRRPLYVIRVEGRILDQVGEQFDHRLITFGRRDQAVRSQVVADFGTQNSA